MTSSVVSLSDRNADAMVDPDLYTTEGSFDMTFARFMQEHSAIPPDIEPKRTRLGRIVHVAGAFGRRDPSLFIAAFAVWALASGVSLLVTDHAFTRTPVYYVARDLGLNDDLVGLSMVANAVILLWGLGDMPPRLRAVIVLSTGIVWTFWSVIIFMGGLKVGLYSSGAAWTLICSLALMRTTAVSITEHLKGRL